MARRLGKAAALLVALCRMSDLALSYSHGFDFFFCCIIWNSEILWCPLSWCFRLEGALCAILGTSNSSRKWHVATPTEAQVKAFTFLLRLVSQDQTSVAMLQRLVQFEERS